MSEEVEKVKRRRRSVEAGSTSSAPELDIRSLSVTHAARLLKVSPKTVRAHIRRGLPLVDLASPRLRGGPVEGGAGMEQQPISTSPWMVGGGICLRGKTRADRGPSTARAAAKFQGGGLSKMIVRPVIETTWNGLEAPAAVRWPLSGVGIDPRIDPLSGADARRPLP